METTGMRRGLVVGCLAALALAGGAGRCRADMIINQFNDASEVSQWRFDFGNAGHSVSFDPGADADANAASGAMKITLTFDAALAGDNKGAYTRDIFPGLDGSTFSGMQMDLKIDSTSATDFYGNNGYFQLVIRNGGNYDYDPQFGDNVRGDDTWRHISVEPGLSGAVDNIRGITIQLYGGPSQNITGPVTLWIDNVVFTTTPEPSALALLATSAIVGLGRRRR